MYQHETTLFVRRRRLHGFRLNPSLTIWLAHDLITNTFYLYTREKEQLAPTKVSVDHSCFKFVAQAMTCRYNIV